MRIQACLSGIAFVIAVALTPATTQAQSLTDDPRVADAINLP